MAVVRLRAKIDTVVSPASTSSTKNVPTIGQPADGQRQHRGDHAAEDEDQQDQA